ncbi:MAG TPA: GNAT family N-acetyltransferase [Pyrinomonadaceae bacterium]|nr:GNAT family N-acetyltransferase [Pyrinomonadaceae bacterium]
MNVKIRLARIDDIPAIQNLIHDSVSALSAAYYSPSQISSALEHVFGPDSQLIIDGTYFLADANGDIAGSGGWSKRKTLFGGDQAKSSTDELLDPASEAARIRAFYVHPRWSRKGIASQILTACEEAARACGFRRLELAATLPGEPFYLARGYRKFEPIEIKTPDGQSLDAFRMEKEI